MKLPIKAATSALALAALLATAPALAEEQQPAAAAANTSTAAPTVAEADAFVADAEKQLADLGIYGAQVAWINATYITDDTDAVNARVGAEFTEMQVRYASGEARFDGLKGLSYDTRRKLDILKQSIVLPAPATPGAMAVRLAACAMATPVKVSITPHTVPSRPMKGPPEMAVASTIMLPSSAITSSPRPRSAATRTVFMASGGMSVVFPLPLDRPFPSSPARAASRRSWLSSSSQDSRYTPYSGEPSKAASLR